MSSNDKPQKVLSCVSCRQRKIKCPKEQPVCAQCSRFGFECVYPTRKAMRRAPRPRQKELMERLSRLESIVSKVDPHKLSAMGDAGAGAGAGDQDHGHDDEDGDDNDGGDYEEEQTRGIEDRGETAPAKPGAGRTDADDRRSRASKSLTPGASGNEAAAARFVSGEFWDNLCDEVEGIRHALNQTSEDDEDDEEAMTNSPSSSNQPLPLAYGPSGYVLGNPDHHKTTTTLSHPSPDVRGALWAVYARNVDPIIKILHRPTVVKQMGAIESGGLAGQNASPASLDALFYAVYFAAVLTLSPEECQRRTGQHKNLLVDQFRVCTERSLAAADYLNTEELTTLQAATIYVVCIHPTHTLTHLEICLARDGWHDFETHTNAKNL
jgi:hypothetical protein